MHIANHSKRSAFHVDICEIHFCSLFRKIQFFVSFCFHFNVIILFLDSSNKSISNKQFLYCLSFRRKVKCRKPKSKRWCSTTYRPRHRKLPNNLRPNRSPKPWVSERQAWKRWTLTDFDHAYLVSYLLTIMTIDCDFFYSIIRKWKLKIWRILWRTVGNSPDFLFC